MCRRMDGRSPRNTDRFTVARAPRPPAGHAAGAIGYAILDVRVVARRQAHRSATSTRHRGDRDRYSLQTRRFEIVLDRGDNPLWLPDGQAPRLLRERGRRHRRSRQPAHDDDADRAAAGECTSASPPRRIYRATARRSTCARCWNRATSGVASTNRGAPLPKLRHSSIERLPVQRIGMTRRIADQDQRPRNQRHSRHDRDGAVYEQSSTRPTGARSRRRRNREEEAHQEAGHEEAHQEAIEEGIQRRRLRYRCRGPAQSGS